MSYTQQCFKLVQSGTILNLKVAVESLDHISTNGQFHDHGDKLREALKIWLKAVKNPTWQDIVNTLKSPVIGEPKLAEGIKAKHCTTSEASGQQPQQSRGTVLQWQTIQDSQERSYQGLNGLLGTLGSSHHSRPLNYHLVPYRHASTHSTAPPLPPCYQHRNHRSHTQ